MVASCGSLSSRQRPVNRGNRIDKPASPLSSPQPAVWLGDNVSSALSTSTTRLGSNQTSALTCESIRGGRGARISGASFAGSAASSASENPVPHLPTV